MADRVLLEDVVEGHLFRSSVQGETEGDAGQRPTGDEAYLDVLSHEDHGHVCGQMEALFLKLFSRLAGDDVRQLSHGVYDLGRDLFEILAHEPLIDLEGAGDRHAEG